MLLPYRILVIGYLPGINGISTSVLNLYRNLDRNQFQYDFLLPEKYRDVQYPDLQEITSLGANLYFTNYEKYYFPESSHSALKELLLSIPNLQGVHVHDLNMMSSPLYIADKLGFPIKVIHCHTAKAKSEINTNKNDPSFYTRLNLIQGDQFDRLACSDLAGIYDYPNLPYTVLPNGVDTRRFSFNHIYRSLLREKLNISEEACVIGSVSKLSSEKNHLFSIRVFHQFLKLEPDSHYLIVGSGGKAKEIRSSIEKNHLSQRVHLLGEQREVDMFYSAMDILLHPSLSEGLPNVLIEAQSAGLPCLISDQISDMAKITPLVTALSFDEDIQKWARTIQNIKKTSRERISQEEAIQSVGYDIRSVTNQLMNIYSKRIESKLNSP